MLPSSRVSSRDTTLHVSSISIVVNLLYLHSPLGSARAAPTKRTLESAESFILDVEQKLKIQFKSTRIERVESRRGECLHSYAGHA